MSDTSTPNSRLDRPCENLAGKGNDAHPWEKDHQRNALDLAKDGAQHRRYHSLYEDLLN